MSITKESFLQDVLKHEMQIKLDTKVNGLPYRHIRFGQPGDSNMHFNLTCIPGRLIYTGDMGTFVFVRTPDMFDFFGTGIRNGGALGINEDYWHEKLEAVDKVDGSLEDDPEAFIQSLNDEVAEYLRVHEIHRDFEKEIEYFKEEVIEEISEHSLRAAIEKAINEEVVDYQRCDKTEPKMFRFGSEGDFKKYTHRFLWCLWAIVWGISQYDDSQKVIAGSSEDLQGSNYVVG